MLAVAGPDLKDAAGLTAALGGRSERIIGRLLNHWMNCLTAEERLLLKNYGRGVIGPCPDDLPPPP